MYIIRFFLSCADRYAAQSTWKDFALVKLCLASIGVLLGLSIPARHRKGAALLAGLVALPTYLVLLRRFFPFLWEDELD